MTLTATGVRLTILHYIENCMFHQIIERAARFFMAEKNEAFLLSFLVGVESYCSYHPAWLPNLLRKSTLQISHTYNVPPHNLHTPHPGHAVAVELCVMDNVPDRGENESWNYQTET